MRCRMTLAGRSRAVVVLVAFAVSGGAFACRSRASSATRSGLSDGASRSATPSAASASATSPSASVSAAPTVPAREVAPLTVYFPSKRYVETGDESLPRLVSERHELDLADAGAGADARARALLSALDTQPKSDAATRAIPERLDIRSVDVRDGVAYVDFSRAGLSGGSLEETLLVEAIVRTLTALPDVRAVQFLVDGKVRETLMGHVTTTKPITAESD